MDRILITACLFLACVWAGCAGGGTPADPTLATYERSGGFAGLDTRLVVHDDGTLILEDRKAKRTTESVADPATLDRLRAVLRNPDLAAAAGAYPEPDGADLQTYRMRVSTPAGQKTITTYDAANHPPVVTSLIEAFDALWGEARTAAPR
jgi:hypothetical protein